MDPTYNINLAVDRMHWRGIVEATLHLNVLSLRRRRRRRRMHIFRFCMYIFLVFNAYFSVYFDIFKCSKSQTLLIGFMKKNIIARKLNYFYE